MLIGLTGGIASGKSTVSKYLAELGAVIIDSDSIAYSVLKKGHSAYEGVIKKFGSDILDKNEEINRSHLGSIIFNDSAKRRELEKITHPHIISKILKKMEDFQKKDRIIILDAPLLFEVNLDRIVDQTWVVYVDRETQMKRLLARDHLSPTEAERRIESQLSLEKKRSMADVVIDNMGSIEELKEDVLQKWRDLDEN